MDVNGVRQSILELAAYYFQGTTVTFARQSRMAKQGVPLITLYTGTMTRPINPPVRIIDGNSVSFYPSSVTVQIDLFTKGRKVETGSGYLPIMENTAVDDLTGFLNFLNSEYAVNYCDEKDIAVVIPNTVQDLTGLIDDTNYEYRAMAELTVYFTAQVIGYSGTLSSESVKHKASETNPPPGREPGEEYTGGDAQADDVTGIKPAVTPSPSGGGNPEVIDEEQKYFEDVRLFDKNVKEDFKK